MAYLADLDESRLNPVIASLGLGDLVSITPMQGGSFPVFRLDLTSGSSLVLKVYPDGNGPANETFAARQLLNIGISVTRHLIVDETKTRLPYDFSVANYLPGAAVKTFANHADIASLYSQMGATLRAVHSLAMPAYGRFDANGIVSPLPTNQAFIAGLLDNAFGQFARFGADPDLATRLRRIADDAFAAVVPFSRGAVLVHDDMQPNNVLATEVDGKLVLSGLIDFGNAHAADAIYDLAKCLFCSEHEAPGSTAHILDGYGPIDHPNPAAALAFYTLLHRVIMWWFLRHIGVIPTPEAPSDIMTDLRQTTAIL